MYLSRLILNPRSRQVQSELSNPYQMHRTVFSGFPTTLPADERVLYRLEERPNSGLPLLLVQSLYRPDWSRLCVSHKDYLVPERELQDGHPNPAVKAFDPVLCSGRYYRFRLLANPTAKKDREDKKQGRRQGLLREEDQRLWLQRKLEVAGAELIECRISPQGFQEIRMEKAGNANKQTHLSVLFEGILIAREVDSLTNVLREGIGPAKSFGFGLLSLALMTA